MNAHGLMQRHGAVWIAMLAALIAGLSGTAEAQTLLGYERSISGLNPNGTLVPGTTTLEVTVSVSLAQSGPEAVTGVAMEEFLPVGWSFAGLVAGPTNPAISPSPGKEGQLDFLYFVVPPIPLSFTYTVNVPANPTLPTAITGSLLYRTDGPELEAGPVSTEILGEVTEVTATRTFGGPGFENGFYRAGEQIELEVVLEKEGSEAIQALGYQELVPAGVTFVSVSGPNTPPITPQAGASGELEFGFIQVPAFPAQFTIVLQLDASLGSALNFFGTVLYRLTEGGELTSSLPQETLDPAPCVTFTRSGATSYRPGEEVTFTITIEADCPGPLTALGLLEIIPDGWTFVGTGGATPPAFASQFPGTGEVEFGYIQVPSLPTSFSYTIAAPIDEDVDPVTVCGQALYRLGTVELQSPEVCTDLVLTQNAFPVITLVDGNIIELECGTSYIEPGFSAFDEEDGDLTDQVVVTGSVDSTTPGSNAITYQVSDSDGGNAVAVRTVNVVDTTPPVLSLVGGTVTVQCGGVFNDPGATATDICAGNLNAEVQATSTVNTSVPGTYTVTYNVSDPSGNAAEPIVRTVNVVDTTPPVINLNGPTSLTVECNVSFNDPGATATDTCAGNVSGSITVTGSVNTAQPGTYTLTYRAVDPAGNQAQPRTRTVTVVDTTPPTISLVQAGAQITVECGSVYTDPGATATDSCAGAITVAIDTSGVDTSTAGTYQVNFRAEDPAGNVRTATRNVQVVDTTAPVISLIGANPFIVECGSAYTDPGATASDVCEGDVEVTTDASGVNMNVPGLYTVNFTATDGNGNSTSATRSVEVRDTTAPVITLNGDETIVVECTDSYEDPGATAQDSCSGDLSAAISVESNVDVAIPGVYTVSYSVEDAFGNGSTASRTVIVEDTTAPEITLIGEAEVSIECTESYEELGATVADICGGELDAELVISGSVDTGVPGVYEISYNATDGEGNAAETVVRTVTVVDTTAPIIALNGPDRIEVTCDVPYVDPGATAVDGCSGEIEVSVDASAVDFEVSGEYTVFFEAEDAAGNVATATRTVFIEPNCFNIICADGNDNGLLDTPFQCLNADRNTFRTEVDSENCPRVTEFVTWFDGGNGNITIELESPVDNGQVVRVSVPRRAINRGEQGILQVSISCDLPSLFAPEDTSFPEAVLPPDVSPTAPFFLATLLVSSDGGETFTQVTELGDGRAIEVSVSGLIIGKDNSPLLLQYPIEVFDFPREGVSVLPGQGMWEDRQVVEPSFEEETLDTATASFSAFAIADRISFPGDLEVFPPGLNFGMVRVGTAVEAPLSVGNLGGSTLTGQAELIDPTGSFAIVSSAGYELIPGQFQILTVRFEPKSRGISTATIVFPDGDDVIEITIGGMGTLIDKNTAILGCGGGAGGYGAADGLVLMAGLALLLGWRVYRRREV